MDEDIEYNAKIDAHREAEWPAWAVGGGQD